jgi:hypothetical protein
MKVTPEDIAEYESEGYEVTKEQDRGETVHVLYRDGEPAGTRLEWLPDRHSVAAREARRAAYERRPAERDREAGG